MSKYDLFLGDILRGIEMIENSGIGRGVKYSLFVSDGNLFDATTMRLQVIGESLSKLPKKLLEDVKGVDVKRFLQTRNIVSHVYFAIKPEIIWSIALYDVPKLKKGIVKLRRNIKQ
jgi:uncharacterized protein with HEPN domain